MGDGEDSPPARRLVGLIARRSPARLLYLGDVYDSGTAEDFRTNFPFGALNPRVAPTPGNHDWPNHAQGYDPYWGRIANGRPPRFYSLRLAGWQILSLNSEQPLASSSAQMRWLREQVRRPGTCRLAFWHRPRFSAGRHGDQDDVEPLWNAVRGRAALVINGHDHDMQQLRPIGTTTPLVSGAGGRGLYSVDRSDRRLAWSNDREFGGLRLSLRRGRARFQFVADTGRVLHSRVRTVHPLMGALRSGASSDRACHLRLSGDRGQTTIEPVLERRLA